MYNTTQDLLDAYRATPDTLTSLLQNVSQEQATAARGGDENWSVIEVLCHLRDAEERNLERIQLMRTQDNPILESYNQEQWARERNYAAAHLDEALDAFLKFRALTLYELTALAPHEWQRPGRHSEVGQIDIVNYMQHIVSHDSIHLAQIARQLQGV
jgi:uncharacterized damage-inducible protein DinB